MTIYQDILTAKESGQKLLAVLIDPEKIETSHIYKFLQKLHLSFATHILVGGSTDRYGKTEEVVLEIKKYTTLPVILFPGDTKQVSPKADGILFLSLLSGRNPKYLIEQQIDAALAIHQSNLEVLPTGYILVDGGKETSVERVSKTKSISQTNDALLLKTALAGQFSGKRLLYLEAGSGAKTPVSSEVIRGIKSELTIPLIVGGGIRNRQQLNNAYDAGADMVVIGTAFEKDPSFFDELKAYDCVQNRQIQLENSRHHL